MEPLVLDYAATPKPRGRVVRLIALYTLFTATGIVLGMIVGATVAPRPTYKVSAFLTLAPGLSDPQTVTRTAQSIVHDINQPKARRRLIDNAISAAPNAPHSTINQIAEALTIAHLSDTKLIRIDATGPDPALAPTCANAAAQTALTAGPLQVMAYAAPPGARTGPSILWTLAGPILGGVLFPLFCWR